ncbi:phospholipase D family protein [Marilutibacter chinensis]|uniref:Phospholipase D family protein n=1 Tax=Marilutibacter chinensis TaxID=2912247 RepID=A0ABS9HRT1_9GAMM|nr:phospholipase D family protein [Lysobacter chinensis]MCF7221635.1 phospholipase D family protein [Lysobacter chinensis]
MGRKIKLGLTALGVLLLSTLLFVLLGFSTLPPRPEGPPVFAIPAGRDARLDAVVQPALDERPGQSGFHLVSDGVAAFALRGLSGRAAERSLDLQYYIWHDDMTGRLLALELIEAADRGVRVRLLLDDMDARAKNFALAALAAHPNIDVRLFNPFASRRGLFGKGMEAITSFSRINHRMHNKSWIVDNRFAIAGGRNIGDEYFSASDHVNFNDLDLAFVGPAVEELSASFDRYWNSAQVWPIESLSPDAVTTAALDTLRRQARDYAVEARGTPYIQAMEGHDAVAAARAMTLPMHWTGRWQVLSDAPDKAAYKDSPMEGSAVLSGLNRAVDAADDDVVLISPYFVPGATGAAQLTSLVADGREVRILTNSLAANDVAAVHGGYAGYRKTLLAGGVKLWELKPEHAQDGDGDGISLFGSSGASLHSKAALIDGHVAFVGSFNLDPRSVSLNCEQGILVDEPAIAAEVAALFGTMTSPAAAWEVTLDGGELRWNDGTGSFDREPDAGFGRRFQAWLARWLPVEALL